MYTPVSVEQQYSWTHDWFVVPQLDENHQLIKITKFLNWTSLSEKLSKFYCSNNGRPSKSLRAKIGLLLVKHLYKLSDVEIVDILKRDIYVQYLCDVSLKEAQTFINSSTLTKFRKQIGIEGIKIIEEEIFVSLKRAKLFKGKRLITDTTVVPSSIAYPTDISLLEKTRQRAIKYLKKAREFGAKTYRTYKRMAKKTYVQYQKVRQHTVKSRKRTQEKLQQFTNRNIKQLKDALENIGNSATDSMHKIKAQFIKEAGQFLDIASNVIEQQKISIEDYLSKSV